MNDRYAGGSPDNRLIWWQAQRGDFGLPDFIYTLLVFAVILVFGLGAGSAFIGLFPGVNTQTASISGAGVPWLGLLALVVTAAIWFGVELRYGFSWLILALIVVGAAAVSAIVSTLSLDVLAAEEPDAFVGGLGLLPLIGVLLLAVSAMVGEGLILGASFGLLAGILIGGLAGFPISFNAVLIMMLIFAPVGVIAGGFGGLIRAAVRRRRR